jgi:putative glutamine amidotransferase
MTKPLIGMNADYRPGKHDAPAFSYVASGYYDAIIKAGGIPVIFPPFKNPEDLQTLLDHLDGVLLIGGADLDPRNDGWMLHPTVRTQDPRRELFDRCLVQQVAERRIPIFGVGSGMQLINVSQGGNLLLHIPEDMPHALPHKDPLDSAHRHTLELAPGSIMDRVYGDGELRVNSMHHMAIDEVAPGFAITARCPDGVVEAIESTMLDWFAFGTQFHPEAKSASALDRRIFEEFVTGITISQKGAPAEINAASHEDLLRETSDDLHLVA